jgi:hypothetical protein
MYLNVFLYLLLNISITLLGAYIINKIDRISKTMYFLGFYYFFTGSLVIVFSTITSIITGGKRLSYDIENNLPLYFISIGLSTLGAFLILNYNKKDKLQD